MISREVDPTVLGSDYINANYIKQEEDGRSQGFKQYIATQVLYYILIASYYLVQYWIGESLASISHYFHASMVNGLINLLKAMLCQILKMIQKIWEENMCTANQFFNHYHLLVQGILEPFQVLSKGRILPGVLIWRNG